MKNVQQFAAMGVCSALLVACGGTEEVSAPQTTATLTSTTSSQAPASSEASSAPETSPEESSEPAPQETEVPSGEVTEVDPAAYAQGENYIFGYNVGGEKGECFISNRGVSCTGNAPENAPEIQMPPFARQQPKAIAAGPQGLYYTVFEGVPPAQAELAVGQKIQAGAGSCVAETPELLRCEAQGHAFSIQAPNRLIVPEGELTPVYEVQ
ncbi:hypothetical protein [Corynebacterium gerontici]|uniref:Lipoprotein n=1 Tax=Corynebacterium gerontici TaxID=2079234 RepID=A0A3G6J1T5_9CORY|nr:hypothetical protein [Corynebacterium gerontici]AZA12021.1 hypothetical protein CGERO_08650 [Corynebacterium gerontici]